MVEIANKMFSDLSTRPDSFQKATPAVGDLYARNPGAVDVTPSQEAAAADTPSSAEAIASTAGSTAAQAANAELSGYSATRSADELIDITSQDSPLMQRAAQQGVLSAARRGLQNTSIAAGAAQGEMVDRASPLALADAAALNRAAEFTAQQQNVGTLESARFQQEAEIRNAEAQDRMAQLNAQMETAVSQGNAQEQNRLNALIMTEQNQINQFNASQEQQRNLTDAAATNAMRRDVLQANAELNRQFLAGGQALDLAEVQGRYNQLISSNQTASDLYQSYFNSISQAMANDQLAPERIAQYVSVQQTMLEAGLRMVDQMNTLDLGDFQLPGAASTGGVLAPTPGSIGGETVKAPTQPPPRPNVPATGIAAPSPGINPSIDSSGPFLTNTGR